MLQHICTKLKHFVSLKSRQFIYWGEHWFLDFGEVFCESLIALILMQLCWKDAQTLLQHTSRNQKKLRFITNPTNVLLQSYNCCFGFLKDFREYKISPLLCLDLANLLVQFFWWGVLTIFVGVISLILLWCLKSGLTFPITKMAKKMTVAVFAMGWINRFWFI